MTRKTGAPKDVQTQLANISSALHRAEAVKAARLAAGDDNDGPGSYIPKAGLKGLSLADLAGMDDAVAWGQALAQDIRDYEDRRIPWSQVDAGAVIFGPPGTGKTTFAKALATTCGVPLVATSYARWQSVGDRHLGDTLGAMTDDFEKAASEAPAILFIDELDSLPSRDDMHGNNRSYMVSVVNGLLELIDGLGDSIGVVVLGACNRMDRLDPALLRSGRLEAKLRIDLPSVAALDRILAYHLGSDDLADRDRASLAILCGGMSGADVERLVRNARRIARQHQRAVTHADLLGCIDPDGASLPADIRRRIALHEAGHAVAALRCRLFSTVTASIISQSGSAGRIGTLAKPSTLTADTVHRLLVCLLAGRAAEEVILGNVSAGAGGGADSDLAKATDLVRRSLTTLALMPSSSLAWLGDPEGRDALTYRSRLARDVDAVLRETYEATLAFIRTEQRAVEAIAAALVKRRALTHDDMKRLLHGPSMRFAEASAWVVRQLTRKVG